MSQFEQRVNIRFMCKLGKSASETLAALQQVYSANALKKTAVYDWFSQFKNGQETLENNPRSGRPPTSRNEEMIKQVRRLVRADRKITIAELEQEVGISRGSIHAILTENLEMRRVCAKFVLRLLTTDQMEFRMFVAGDLFQKSSQDSTFLEKIVTGDESWVYAYDPETKMRSSKWHTKSSPEPKKSRYVRSKTKVMLISFFNIDGLVHHEFVQSGQSVIGVFYVQVLQRLRDAIQRKRPDKWQGQWFLHHDNTPSHTSFVVQQCLADKNIPVITQPPYSPDIAPCDFWLFPTLQMGLRGTRFSTVEDIQSSGTPELWEIPQEAFRRCFQQWQNRWSTCVCVCV
uniref:Protein GVQW3-like n=1 Tax=Erpetoichthys calabaricus TaxID=27687 RepID=A0A8C4X9K6_ERPCA